MRNACSGFGCEPNDDDSEVRFIQCVGELVTITFYRYIDRADILSMNQTAVSELQQGYTDFAGLEENGGR